MGDSSKPEVGSIGWRDLTVKNAEDVRDFYQRVVGWESSNHDMGDYSDFNMLAPGSGDCVTGICREQGGEILVEPRAMGGGRFCVIRDPAGAVCALYRA